MDRHSQESLVLAVKNAVALSDGQLTQRDFARMTGISKEQIAKLFPKGGWLELQDRAGIPRHPRFQSPLTDEELLTEFHRVVEQLSEIPSGTQFASLSGMSRSRLAKRFGGWKGTIRRYGQWLRENQPDCPYFVPVNGEIEHRVRHRASQPGVAVDDGTPQSGRDVDQQAEPAAVKAQVAKLGSAHVGHQKAEDNGKPIGAKTAAKEDLPGQQATDNAASDSASRPCSAIVILFLQ